MQRGGGGIFHYQSSSEILKYLSFVCAIIRREKIDIVHFHFAPVYIAVPLKLCFPKVKFISTVHSEYKTIIRRLKFKFSSIALDRILFVSKGAGQCLTDRIRNSSKYSVLYWGVKTSPIVNADLKSDLGIPENDIVLCSIGFNIWIKGFDILINSIKKVITDNSLNHHIKVLIVGVSPESKDGVRLTSLIESNNLSDIVLSLGIRNDIHDILNITDIYLQPSRTEAISLSNMEAMQHGIPIIASKVGGIPEVVQDGYNGYLFQSENVGELSEKINYLVNDTNLRLTMGNNSKTLSKNFSLDESISKMAAIYHM